MNRILAKSEDFFALARYLYWADLRRSGFNDFMEKHGGEAKYHAECLGVYCYWGASLYVVIEGWETAEFKDPLIDALLKISDCRDLLRRLRNGTFHFQPSLTPAKLVGFLQAEETLIWLWMIHEEFCRWLRDVSDTVERDARMSSEETKEWRDSFSALVGRLPARPGEQILAGIREKCDKIRAILATDNGNTESAQDLRASLGLYDVAVKQTAHGEREYRRELLARLGLKPDDYIP